MSTRALRRLRGERSKKAHCLGGAVLQPRAHHAVSATVEPIFEESNIECDPEACRMLQ
jgi:hypothetical protein